MATASHSGMTQDRAEQYKEILKRPAAASDDGDGHDDSPARVKPYDLAVIIGRFEPMHAGHGILINKARTLADNTLVLVGSAKLPRTIKNPFTYEERREMIEGYVDQHDFTHVDVAPLRDSLYSDAWWEKQVQETVQKHLLALVGDGLVPAGKPIKVCIVGYKKDDSSYYLDRFPQWDLQQVEEISLPLDATTIRNLLFSSVNYLELLNGIVPDSTLAFLKQFVKTDEYQRLVREFVKIKADKASWAMAPYPVIFSTADAVVTKAGHILLVRRKDAPGEGLWALPGGFVNVGEHVRAAAIRELIEETAIDLPPGLLNNAFAPEGFVFDHPGRSLRGRTITHAFKVDLDLFDKKPGLPKVHGSDDAAEARWFTIAEVMEMSEYIFEDHLSIIARLLSM
jgi:bifunctional NMN adenylyltransferase/nudix hydrolase